MIFIYLVFLFSVFVLCVSSMFLFFFSILIVFVCSFQKLQKEVIDFL